MAKVLESLINPIQIGFNAIDLNWIFPLEGFPYKKYITNYLLHDFWFFLMSIVCILLFDNNTNNTRAIYL